MREKKVVFITGASSGFGLSIANKLASEGHKVYGTSRAPAKVKERVNFDMLQLDVTSDESVRDCIQSLLSRTERIDAVINNAGVAVVGAIEETTLEQAKFQFETNLWGCVRVTKAVLPVFRRQRKGHIINIGSLAGLVGVPFEGFYTASKHALEGYSKSLRYELETFNIRVTVIEPGFFKTNIHHSFVSATERISDYDGIRPKVLSALLASAENAPPPEIVAELVSKVIRTQNPKFSYRAGKDARLFPILNFFFPNIYNAGAKRKFRLA
ncbi:MAG: SDR family NAD(P)-dependent oxidoreductase [Ignavibacteria bacterium]|nr:MAG: SDR family NAD(P)-dependent oxidoreductase [Ignavibacteria bacterium]